MDRLTIRREENTKKKSVKFFGIAAVSGGGSRCSFLGPLLCLVAMLIIGNYLQPMWKPVAAK